MDRPRSVAMPWYRPEDYPGLLRAIADAGRLPASYETWRFSAEQVEGEITRSGVAVVRVEVRPDAFSDWCRTHGLKADGPARTRYANEHAAASDDRSAGGPSDTVAPTN